MVGMRSHGALLERLCLSTLSLLTWEYFAFISHKQQYLCERNIDFFFFLKDEMLKVVFYSVEGVQSFVEVLEIDLIWLWMQILDA